MKSPHEKVLTIFQNLINNNDISFITTIDIKIVN